MNNTMIETYTQQKKRHSDEFGKFEGIFFAFNNSQFEEGLQKLTAANGAQVTTKEIYSIGAGGFILKSKSGEFDALMTRHETERKELKKDVKKLFDALVYELGNHEYCITYDVSDALSALGLIREDVDPALLKKACKESLEGSV